MNMQHTPPESVEFKYKWHDATGAVTGAEHGRGSFDGLTLRAGKLQIPIGNLIGFQTADSVFFLRFLDEKGRAVRAHIEVYGTDLVGLSRLVNAARSQAFAEKERTKLSKSGTLQTYRDSSCPFCQSTIILTGLPETDQVYCNFCDTLFTVDRNVGDALEMHFRICEKCGMYSRPRSFAVFYFYFLVFTFGFHHDAVESCSGCMRKSAWKMVLGNLLGVLGFPFALMQLYRSYATRKISGRFEGLDDANLLARRGKVDMALEKYEQIMEVVPENAGVKFNIAQGLMVKRDFPHAQQMFELALDDCSNYWPAVHGLIASLEQQGKPKEIAAVQKLWSLDRSQ